MADPRPPTRADLARFIRDQRTLRAFEQLFDAVPAEFIDIGVQLQETTIEASSAAARAIQALGDISALRDELLAGPPQVADDRISQDAMLLALAPPHTPYTQHPVVQYESPAATGFSVSVFDSPDDVRLIITPAAGYAAGTIVLPTSPRCIDLQSVTVTTTQQVTALTLDANGASAVHGAPAALSADAYFTLQYDLTTTSWYRIG